MSSNKVLYSDTIEDLKESIKFYKDAIPQMENDRHHHIMCLSQNQDKIDEYEKSIEGLEKELKERKK